MIRSTLRPAALAVLCAAAGSAGAQGITLTGVLDVAVGRFQGAGAARQWRAESGGMSPSFVALRGTDDLGGGLAAKFALEHEVQLDTGRAGRVAGDAFWSREASVGLSGAFGTTMLGRNPTPLYVSAVLFNPFGDSFAFSPSLRQLFAPTLQTLAGDSRWDNSMAYTSPDFDGLRYGVAANLGENAPGATGKNVGANVLYTRGPLMATLAWEKVRNGTGISTPGPDAPPVDFRHQETWLAGLAYDLDGAKLFGTYGHTRTEARTSATTKQWSLGAALPLGAGRVLAQYGKGRLNVNGSRPQHSILSVGYDHDLSKRTDLYAVLVRERIGSVGSGNTVAGGMRLRF